MLRGSEDLLEDLFGSEAETRPVEKEGKKKRKKKRKNEEVVNSPVEPEDTGEEVVMVVDGTAGAAGWDNAGGSEVPPLPFTVEPSPSTSSLLLPNTACEEEVHVA